MGILKQIDINQYSHRDQELKSKFSNVKQCKVKLNLIRKMITNYQMTIE